MDARFCLARRRGALRGRVALHSVWILALSWAPIAPAQSHRRGQHVAHSQNFIVFADSPQWAAEVADAAERHRRELAVYWLGRASATG